MRCVVVGAGAWGLSAAAELAARGHDVTLLDRHGVGNPLSSSAGPTRLWRLTHPDAVRVRLARRSVDAWERLARASGREVTLRRGLLWRDDDSTLAHVVDALRSEDVAHTEVAAAEVDQFFPGLRTDGRDAVWQPTAGPVFAAEALQAHADLYAHAGGTLVVGPVVREVELRSAGPVVHCASGVSYEAEVVVLAPGPGAAPLLAGLGVQ
ncbi:MAG: FAD-dependent oxidoreductase, partial [Candidatus Nanopelagicales bacterium]